MSCIRWFGVLLLVMTIQGRGREPTSAAAEWAPGVSLELARWRAAALSNVVATMRLRIPEATTEPVTGSVAYAFEWDGSRDWIVLDFKESADHVRGVALDGDTGVEWRLTNEHLLVRAPKHATTGPVTVAVDFVAGETSLNRRDGSLYTLLVPDRARTVFPCFDQPDIKARWRLSLNLPPGWTATSAGADTWDGADVAFTETEPLCTYQFSFVAGRFTVETAERAGRTMRIYHLVRDAAHIARNRDTIFDLHARSLDWLEEYTGIDYPYSTFDIVLIPGFQYGGMEHVGAIQYRERLLMLPEQPSQNQLLGRAHLIAHETAHAWFGNLVTMKWFNEVWLKEVFANLMADKVARPLFPDIDHDLRSYLDHFPPALDIDNSEGAHPILQDLPNLNEAGSIYGALVYHKAPIMMRQLELLIGEEQFQEGLRAYLRRFAHGNADWGDLIAALSERAPPDLDLAAWSREWVESARLPKLRFRYYNGIDACVEEEFGPRQTRLVAAWSKEGVRVAPPPTGNPDPPHKSVFRTYPELCGRGETALLDCSGLWYGLGAGCRWRSSEPNYAAWTNPLHRAIAYQNDFRTITEKKDCDRLARWCATEADNGLCLEYLLRQLRRWRWKTHQETPPHELGWELALLRRLEDPAFLDVRPSLLRTLAQVADRPDVWSRLRGIWDGSAVPEGMVVSERDRLHLAFALALRLQTTGQADAEVLAVLDTEAARIESESERERFAFVRRALHPDSAERVVFARELLDPANRAREPWVAEALGWLHHLKRRESHRALLRPALEELPEIQETGDIFFPKQWLTALLRGYCSPEAETIVRGYLADNPDLPQHLRLKVLQAADDLFRCAKAAR